jgi:biotin operon repressor
MSKKSTGKNNFYLSVLNTLKDTTDLTKIREKLGISKQNLNYYLRELKKKQLIMNRSDGRWELVKSSKNLTKYGSFLPKDFIRAHAYIIEVKLPKIEKWEKRIEILEEKKINYKLVGALKQTPRIIVMNRKVWLCNDHLRIFDKKNESYYGDHAIEGRKQAFWTFFKIIKIIENKFGILIRPFNFEWRKEHYSFIKNDLAIDQNQKGIIWRISDESGEWLLIDDSLGEGGELENTGKEAFMTNPKMQKWWNEEKETNFEVGPKFILKVMNGIQQNQLIYSENIKTHIKAIQDLGNGVKEQSKIMKQIKNLLKGGIKNNANK